MKERHKTIVAVYLVLQNEDQVLFLKRHNTGYCDHLYGLPSGHVEQGESTVEAMVREAEEELALTVSSEHLNLVHVRDRNAADGHRIDFFFTCSQWDGEPINAEPHKCSELRWLNALADSAEVIPYVKEVVQLVMSGSNYSLENW